MGVERCFSLPVLLVLFLILFVYHTIVLVVIQPWLGLDTAPGVLNAAVLTFCAVMALLAYALAVVRDPGEIPSLYLPETEDGASVIQEVKRKGGEVRFCQKCSHYKPPRAHHCRICNRCNLRMDHHCVWINNCVGLRNYKAFFLFVLYTVLALAHCVVMMLGQVFDEMDEQSQEPLKLASSAGRRRFGLTSMEAFSVILRVLCGVITAPLLLALGVLLCWHCYLMTHNKTTIEHHEGVRAKWLARKAGETAHKHPYDCGVVNNLIQILGPNFMLWPFPSAVSHIGAGLRYETAYDDPVMPKKAGREEGGLVDEAVLLSPTLGAPIGAGGPTRRRRLPC
eukprot:TRINITY_DN36403_c0_g1_i1.p1 TRINITY_DN36403_c0_g1~~TRINITY_DN36403_c0_g1_i1.p1  ORF type:complete len:338 (-),score=36.49 TRINITY_DN36403_c0_g1_i1:189-1202(-)